MAFTTEDKKISGLLEKRIYLIPRNQRRYVWKTENWKDMMEDLEFTINNPSRAHFMGSVVFERKGNNGHGEGVEVFSIIDGQQRITTFLLFLSTIMFIFKERSERASFEGLKSYLITTNLANEPFCKLNSERYPSLDTFIKNVCDWDKNYGTLTKLIAESSTASKQNQEIFNAVRYFYEKLKVCETTDVEKYRNALLTANVAEIIATSEEDAYTIFEILNARGQILEDYELIKNFIMRYYKPSDAVDIAKNKWESEIIQPLGNSVTQFVKHYVTHRYAKSGSSHNFNYDVLKSETDKHQVKSLLDDLCRKASYYKIIIDPKTGEDGNCSEVEYGVYSFMISNRGVLFRPMFLSLIHRYKTGEITQEVYEGVLMFIKYFFICYNLLGRLTSNKLADTVQTMSKELEDNYSPDVLRKFVNGIVNRMPTLDEFTKSFQLIAWSKSNEFHRDYNQKRRVRTALETLEAIETGSWNIGDSTIEHLNPDSDDRTNANIGNLALLEESINGNLHNKPFSEKLEAYQSSNFRTTRNIYQRYHTNPSGFTIDSRAKAMAKKIYDFIDSQKQSLISLLQE